MRKLIVNADDLGADEARNAGIFEAIHAGTVTSASILPNGPALNDVLRRIRSLSQRNVSFGIHLNLSEGKPLSPNLKWLTGQDGCFLKKPHAHELLRGPCQSGGDSGENSNGYSERDSKAISALRTEIAQEVNAQIESLLKAGVRIDHLDGHQHIHVFPAVFPAVVELVRRHEIPWMRIPEEPPPPSGEDGIPDWLREESQCFSTIAGKARGQLKSRLPRTPNHFLGLYLKGRVSPAVLLDLLHGLRPGLTELMVHPGRVPDQPFSSPFSGFSTPDREKELEALLDQSFRQTLENAHISLTSFGEADR
jgi:chitin disaccharide deacetylase